MLRLQSLGLTLFLLIGCLLSYAIVLGNHGIQRYYTLERTLSARSQKASQRLERNHSLLERLHRVRSDRRVLEEVARSKLGVVGKDELVFLFRSAP